MISTASFDGHVTMYSLLGGGRSAHEEVDTCTKVHNIIFTCTCLPLKFGIWCFFSALHCLDFLDSTQPAKLP